MPNGKGGGKGCKCIYGINSGKVTRIRTFPLKGALSKAKRMYGS